MPKKGKTKGKGRAGPSGFSFRTKIGYFAGPNTVTNGVVTVWSSLATAISAKSTAFAQLHDAYRFYKIHSVDIEAGPGFQAAATDMPCAGTLAALCFTPFGSTTPTALADLESQYSTPLTYVGASSVLGAGLVTTPTHPLHLHLGAEHFMGVTGGWMVSQSDASEDFVEQVGLITYVQSDTVLDAATIYQRVVLDVEFKEPLDPASISLASRQRLLSASNFIDQLKEMIEKAGVEDKARLLQQLLPSFK